jgi:sigma-54-interacting transcriptional regulator
MLLGLTFRHPMSSQRHHTSPEHATTNTDLRWALNLPTNVLILGARDADVAAVLTNVTEPVTVMADGPVNDLAGTCIIPNAVRLTRDQQHALRSRLEREPALRLVIVSPVLLYPFVESGQFDETLYYRLNTITIDLTSESTAA